MINIYTHCDSFHADELMAIALLARFHFDVSVEALNVIRTRDENILSVAKNSNDFVIDVGREYNSEKLNFDHHQSDPNLVWENGGPLSSCGLIFRWLKKEGKLQSISDYTISKLADFAYTVDQHDNGKQIWEDNKFFRAYNHSDDRVIENKQFRKALRAAEDYVDNLIFKTELEKENNEKIEKAIKESIDNNHEDFLIVYDSLPGGRDIAVEKSKAKLYIAGYKDEEKGLMEWSVKSIPSDINDPFSSRQRMPKAWCGVEGQALKDISGFNLRFCHKGGFICVLEGSEQEVKELAKTIINIEKAE